MIKLTINIHATNTLVSGYCSVIVVDMFDVNILALTRTTYLYNLDENLEVPDD